MYYYAVGYTLYIIYSSSSLDARIKHFACACVIHACIICEPLRILRYNNIYVCVEQSFKNDSNKKHLTIFLVRASIFSLLFTRRF